MIQNRILDMLKYKLSISHYTHPHHAVLFIIHLYIQICKDNLKVFTKDLNVYSKDALRTHRVKGEDSDSSMKGELCFGPLTPITFVASTNHASNRFQQIMSSILIFVVF